MEDHIAAWVVFTEDPQNSHRLRESESCTHILEYEKKNERTETNEERPPSFKA